MGAYWILLIAAVVIFLQGMLFKRLALSRLNYSRSFQSSACYEGDSIELIETIENRKALPVPWLRVESQFRTGLAFESQLNLSISEGQYTQNHKSFFSLLPWTKIVRRHRIAAKHRGVYRLGTVSMTTGDLVGMQSMVRSQAIAGGITVYPLPMDISEMDLPVRTWIGDLLVRRWIMEDPFQISGVREYRSGDPMKDIQWKATARTGSLQVYRRDTTADCRIVLYLNIEDHEGMWTKVTRPEPIEYGIRLAAGIAAHLIPQGIEVGFATNGMFEEDAEGMNDLPPASGAEQQALILDRLARLELTRRLSFHDFLLAELERLEEPQDMILLTTYVNPRLEEVFRQLEAKGHTVQVTMLEGHETRQEVSA